MSDTTVRAKATEVQEAAASAVLAEREDLHRLLENAESGEAGYSAPEMGSDEFESICQYPADPYEMSEISQIPSHVLWLSVREPDGLPGKQSSVESAQTILNAVIPEGFGRLFALVNSGKFEGSTKNAFVDYIDIIEGIAENQANLADELAHGVECVYNGLTAAKDDVVNICDRTIKALNDIAEGGGNSGGGEAMAFSLLGALVGVAASVATGGTAGIVFSLISGGVSLAGTAATSGAAESLTITGVLDLFATEVETRRKEHEKHEEIIVEGLELDLASVDGSGVIDLRDKLDKNAGGLADRRGDFHATDAATAADLKELYDLATNQVPDLADEFSTASDYLNEANGTEVWAMGPASSPWEDLLDKLQRYVAEDGKELHGAAKVLARAAQDFAEQDGVNAKWVRQPIEQVIDPEDPSFPAPDVVYGPPSGVRYGQPSGV